jgi:hypothetical protein
MNIFFDLDVDDDPRNSSSYSLLIISKNEESIDFHKRYFKILYILLEITIKITYNII